MGSVNKGTHPEKVPRRYLRVMRSQRRETNSVIPNCIVCQEITHLYASNCNPFAFPTPIFLFFCICGLYLIFLSLGRRTRSCAAANLFR